MRILVIEDHPMLGQDLKKGLESSHYSVDLVESEDDALAKVSASTYNLIILDLFLPGWNLCQKLRERQIQHERPGQHEQKTLPPILCLTVLNRMDQRVKGFELDADDYLVKPFAFGELEVRVRALLRRERVARTPILRFMDITLDTRTHEVRRGQRSIELSRREYALLDFLMRSQHYVLSRSMIAEHVWDYDADHLSNVIDIYIHYLRSKLCAGGEPDVIQAVSGAGYQLKESAP